MKLIKATTGEFNPVYSAMKRNFTQEEIRDYDFALAVMKEEQYSIYHITDGDTRVGFCAIWELSEFAFIEHFVIYESFRCKGYGTRVLELIKESFKTIVLEVEPPQDEMKARRIAFYKRCGFFKNGIEYTQPPYRPSDEAVKLILLSYPERLKDAEAVKKELYRSVYKISD